MERLKAGKVFENMNDIKFNKTFAGAELYFKVYNTKDCAVRAVALIEKLDYLKCYDLLNNLTKEYYTGVGLPEKLKVIITTPSFSEARREGEKEWAKNYIAKKIKDGIRYHGTPPKVTEKYLTEHGYKHISLNDKGYNVDDEVLTELIKKFGKSFIIETRKHLTAMVNGQLGDSGDIRTKRNLRVLGIGVKKVNKKK